MVLSVGNYMNGGNRTRGQADGFDLDFLAKVRDIKMNSGGTLLLFIARQYIIKYQMDVIDNEPKCPVPNITSILKGFYQASKISQKLKLQSPKWNSISSRGT